MQTLHSPPPPTPSPAGARWTRSRLQRLPRRSFDSGLRPPLRMTWRWWARPPRMTERSERQRTQSKDPRESRNAVTRLHGLPPTLAAAPGAQKRWRRAALPLIVGTPNAFPRRAWGLPCSHAAPLDVVPLAATPSGILRLRPSASTQDDGRGRRPCLPQ